MKELDVDVDIDADAEENNKLSSKYVPLPIQPNALSRLLNCKKQKSISYNEY